MDTFIIIHKNNAFTSCSLSEIAGTACCAALHLPNDSFEFPLSFITVCI